MHLSPCICLKYRITTLIKYLQCETTEARVGQTNRQTTKMQINMLMKN